MSEILGLIFCIVGIPMLMGTVPFWLPAARDAVAMRSTPTPSTALIIGIIGDGQPWKRVGYIGRMQHPCGLVIYEGKPILPNGAEPPLTWRCRAQIKAAWKAREQLISAQQTTDGLMAMANGVIALHSTSPTPDYKR